LPLAIVRAAADDYHLRRNHQEMTALLHAKNAELSALNSNLEDGVGERARATCSRPSSAWC